MSAVLSDYGIFLSFLFFSFFFFLLIFSLFFFSSFLFLNVICKKKYFSKPFIEACQCSAYMSCDGKISVSTSSYTKVQWDCITVYETMDLWACIFVIYRIQTDLSIESIKRLVCTALIEQFAIHIFASLHCAGVSVYVCVRERERDNEWKNHTPVHACDYLLFERFKILA